MSSYYTQTNLESNTSCTASSFVFQHHLLFLINIFGQICQTQLGVFGETFSYNRSLTDKEA